jgi:hypothetical protein
MYFFYLQMASLSSGGDANVPHEESLYNNQDMGSNPLSNTQAVLSNLDGRSVDNAVVGPIGSTFNEEITIFDGGSIVGFHEMKSSRSSDPQLREAYSKAHTHSIEALFDRICKLKSFGDSLGLLVDCAEHLGSSEEKMLFISHIICVIMDHMRSPIQDRYVAWDRSELLNFLDIARESIVVSGQFPDLDGSYSMSFARELIFLLDEIYSSVKKIHTRLDGNNFFEGREIIMEKLQRLRSARPEIKPHPQTDGFSSKKVIRITRRTLLGRACKWWGKAKDYLNRGGDHSELTSDERNILVILCLSRSYRLLIYLRSFTPWKCTSDFPSKDLMEDLEKVYALRFEILKISESQNSSLPFFEYIKALLDRTEEITRMIMKKSGINHYSASS